MTQAGDKPDVGKYRLLLMLLLFCFGFFVIVFFFCHRYKVYGTNYKFWKGCLLKWKNGDLSLRVMNGISSTFYIYLVKTNDIKYQY